MLKLDPVLSDQESPLSGQCELKDDNGATFAVMKADFVFSYGSYGFGESFQVCIVLSQDYSLAVTCMCVCYMRRRYLLCSTSLPRGVDNENLCSMYAFPPS